MSFTRTWPSVTVNVKLYDFDCGEIGTESSCNWALISENSWCIPKILYYSTQHNDVYLYLLALLVILNVEFLMHVYVLVLLVLVGPDYYRVLLH